MSYRVLLTGGGTGGHVFPLVAVAEELRDQAKQKSIDLELHMMGDGDMLRDAAKQNDISFSNVPGSKWRRYGSLTNLTDILLLPFRFLIACVKVWWWMPDVIFSKGGYAGFLPALAGALMFVPLYIHESDTIPGKANKRLATYARRIFLSFASSAQYFNKKKIIVTGYPIQRAELKIYDKTQALESFGLDASKPTVFIMGGSQGAKIINDTVTTALIDLIKQYHVIHQCGQMHFETLSKLATSIVKEEPDNADAITKGYRLYPFLSAEQLALAYSASDVVVSRAGAGSIFEIAAAGKPAIILPLTNSANNHQFANAQEFAKFGAVVIAEANFTPHLLLFEINNAYQKRDELSQKIKQFATLNASSVIASELLRL